jgi:hypothetical protein
MLPSAIGMRYGRHPTFAWAMADDGTETGSARMPHSGLDPDRSTGLWGNGVTNSVQPSSRAIETLARKLYEASEPDGISWLRLGWTVRESWQNRALQEYQTSDRLFERIFPWRRTHALLILATLGSLPFR